MSNRLPAPWAFLHQGLQNSNCPYGTPFVQHCQRRGIRPFPASPAACADWINELPDKEIEPAIEALVAIHESVSASNPCATLSVRTVVERRLRAEAPHGWNRADRQAFLSLPRDIQLTLARREAERNAALRTAQNRLAEEKKKLSQQMKHASADAEPKEEVENVKE